MSRKTSEAGVDALTLEEGVVLRPYRDIAGIPTQGVGHTNAAGAPEVRMDGPTWTREYAVQVLKNDLAREYEPAVEREMPGVVQHAFDGGVSFHFNTGAIKKASWVKAFMAGAPWRDKLMLWNRAGGKAVAGLTSRRAREADMIEFGIYRGRSVVLDKNSAVGRQDEVRALQQDLGLLGFYHGEINGVWNSATEAAVRSFQSTHPDLATDGRVGPATRSQIARAKALLTSGGAGAGSAGGAVVGATAGAPGWVIGALVVVSLILLGFAAWRFWPEIQQRLNKWRGKHVP